MNHQFKLLTLVFFLIQGCSNAQQATEVNAVKYSVAPYLKMDCQSLSIELNNLYRDASISSNQVDQKYNDDKSAEVVAWVLFWPAAFALEGNQEEVAKLASIKGQIEAIQDALVINGCKVRYQNSRYDNSRYDNSRYDNSRYDDSEYDNSGYENPKYEEEKTKTKTKENEPRMMKPSKPSRNPGIRVPFKDKP